VRSPRVPAWPDRSVGTYLSISIGEVGGDGLSWILVTRRSTLITRRSQGVDTTMEHQLATTPLADWRKPSGGDWLSPQQLRQLCPEHIVQRAKGLAPLLAAHAHDAELLRRPVDAVWQALRDSGFFYQFVPKRFGGLETDFQSFFDAVLALAQGCISTAWCAAFCAAHNWYLAHFPLETQSEIWSERPYFIGPLVTGPPGRLSRCEGGYRLNGHWKWASGVMHSDWLILTATLDAANGAEPVNVIARAEDARILDTWHMSGLAGTGSNDILIQDLFVPSHHVTPAEPIRRGRGLAQTNYPNSVFSPPALAFLCVVSAIPQLGGARAAVTLAKEHLGDYTRRGSITAQGERAIAQARIARAEVMVRAAEAVLRNILREAHEIGRLDEPEQINERLRLRTQSAHAVEICRDAVDIVCRVVGSSAWRDDHPLARIKRDLDTASSHAVFDIDICLEAYGRTLVGLPCNTTLT